MGFKKKKNQVLIQTWHGSLGLKRFETTSDLNWIHKAKKMGKMTDYCLSNSTFETNLFKQTFWKDSQILEYGHARNDMLIKTNGMRALYLRNMLNFKYKIPRDSHIFLYAPTYKDKTSIGLYLLNYEAIKVALEHTYGGDWVILVRMHLMVRKYFEQKKIKLAMKGVVDLSNYTDIQDLLIISDMAMTDYSSWICDYIMTMRPAIIYASDYE